MSLHDSQRTDEPTSERMADIIYGCGLGLVAFSNKKLDFNQGKLPTQGGALTLLAQVFRDLAHATNQIADDIQEGVPEHDDQCPAPDIREVARALNASADLFWQISERIH